MLGSEAAGIRLDRALADRFPDHSRTAVAQWIRDGRVRVDGERPQGKLRVAGGERVEVWIPPPRPTALVPEDRPLDVLYEDEDVIALNKPPGLTVHPGSGQHDGTLANALVHHFRNLPERGGADRPGIVHRLDKDTSGVLVVAKHDAAHRTLSEAFAERTVEKTYLACVHGCVEADAGEIELAIGRSPRHRTLMTVRESGGRAATTRWSVERRLPRHTLLVCKPVTGRTHQIRVHLRAIGHPIVGDASYGWTSGAGEALAPRLLLHAWRLVVPHPRTGEALELEAEPPDDFRAAVEALALLPPPRRARRKS